MKHVSQFLAAGLLILLGPEVRASTTYDAAADFSATSNPNGVWSYGWSSTLGSTFTVDTAKTTYANLNFWEGPDYTGAPPGSFPLVGHNGTSQTIDFAGNQVLAGQLFMHPGPQDQYSVIQFTAPSTGTFVLSAAFTGINYSVGTTTDVHVLLNGNSLFNAEVTGFGNTQSFATMLSVAQGDTIDFAVGYGNNGTYYSDSTAIAASLTSVPEPSTMIMAIASCLLVSGYARRRRFAAVSLGIRARSGK